MSPRASALAQVQKMEGLRSERDIKMDELERDSREQKALKSRIANIERDRDIKIKNIRLNENNKGMFSSLEDLMIRKAISLLREQKTEYIGVKKFMRSDASGMNVEIGECTSDY